MASTGTAGCGEAGCLATPATPPKAQRERNNPRSSSHGRRFIARTSWLLDPTPRSLAQVVGAPGGRIFEFTRINIGPTILRKKIEDVREAGAPVLIASGTSRDRTH